MHCTGIFFTNILRTYIDEIIIFSFCQKCFVLSIEQDCMIQVIYKKIKKKVPMKTCFAVFLRNKTYVPTYLHLQHIEIWNS